MGATGGDPSSPVRDNRGDSKRLRPRLCDSGDFFQRLRSSFRSNVHARNCSNLEPGVLVEREDEVEEDDDVGSASVATSFVDPLLSLRSTEKID